MAARRYEKYCTSERSERVKYFFNPRRELSYLQAAMDVMFYLLYKRQWTAKPFHFNSFVVWKTRSSM